MLRDPSLIPLSHQHHNALALCVLTERSLSADSSDDNVRRLAKRVVDRYELEMVNHFGLEESVLFPRVPELRELTERLVAEHREMERLVEGLRTGPLAGLLRTFASLLRQHVRLEEGELFEQVQRLLPRETLDEIGGVLDREAVRICL